MAEFWPNRCLSVWYIFQPIFHNGACFCGIQANREKIREAASAFFYAEVKRICDSKACRKLFEQCDPLKYSARNEPST